MISVAVCTHNGAAFLSEQLRSIIDGGRRPDEIVVSDDASTDETVAIAQQVLAASGVPFVVLRNPSPLGVTANFEAALVATSGDVVVLSDQDDIWEHGRLEASAAAFAEHPRLLLHHSDAELVGASGSSLGLGLFEALDARPEELASLSTDAGFSTLLRRNLVTGATAAIRRELLVDALPFPANWVHDEWLAIIAAARGGIRADRRRLVRYRQHGGNQIGMARRGLATKVSRVLGPEGGRTARLATRADVLLERLRRIGAPEDFIHEAEEKASFERARSMLPVSRWDRIGVVRRLDRAGDYARFASQRRLDILRDLGQSRTA